VGHPESQKVTWNANRYGVGNIIGSIAPELLCMQRVPTHRAMAGDGINRQEKFAFLKSYHVASYGKVIEKP
jgi:hypothetical protein